MKLKKVGLKNFRILRDCSFDLSPLTIIVGPNSSGKSSLFKALLLLQHNLESNGLKYLEFDQGAKHKLGAFSTILNDYSNGTVSFSLVFEEVSFLDRKLNDFWSPFKSFQVSYTFSGQKRIDGVKQNASNSDQIQKGVLSGIAFYTTDEPIFILSRKEDYISVKINLKLILNLFKSSSREGLLWENIYIKDKEIGQAIHDDQIAKDLNFRAEEFDRRVKKEVDLKSKEINTNKKDNKDSFLHLIYEYENITKAEKKIQNKLKKLAKIREELLNEMQSSKTEEKKLEVQKDIDSLTKNIDELEVILDELPVIEKVQADSKYNKELNSDRAEYNINENDEFEEEKDEIEERIKIIEGAYQVDSEGSASEFQNRRKYYREKIVCAMSEFFASKLGEELVYGVDENEEAFWEVKLQGVSRDVLQVLNPTLDNDKWGLRNAIQKKSKSFDKTKDFIEESFLDVILLHENWESFEEELLIESFKGKSVEDYIEMNKIDNILYVEIISKLVPLFSKLRSEIGFTHFSATRGVQQRIFNYTKENDELEEAIAELYNAKSQSDRAEQIDFLKKQLIDFQIGRDIEVKLIDGSSYQVWIKKDNGKLHSIADLGFGITQLLPILIKTSLSINSNHLIGIEEPGTNLHPHLQSNLASFYLRSIDRHTNFIVETHSEYFLRKLQALTAENPDYSSKVKILYMKEGAIYDEISIDENGELRKKDVDTNYVFPSGFYDVNERAIQEREVNRMLHDVNNELESRLKKTKLPLVVTEGKTDWKHMVRAMRKFNELDNLYIDLAEFVELKDKMGEGELQKIIDKSQRVPNPRKLIFIFDRDNHKIIHERGGGENGFKYYKNNIYSFCIPKPDDVEFEMLSIEHYYDESEIKLSDENNRRLYLVKEFYENGLHPSKPELGITCKIINTKLDPNKIIDSGVIDKNGNSFALSKNQFAEYIYNDVTPFDEVSYKRFSLIFDVIEQIKAHKPLDT